MDRLFSPWRSQYIASFKDEKPRTGESLFSRILRERKDAKNLVITRKKYCFVMMNLYPYNSGHLMIVPYRQTPDIVDLTTAEQTEIMQTMTEMVSVLTSVLHPHGFNIGANIGRAGGAGVDDHIHFHIVPRWNGDTNFMPVVGDIKVVSEDMKTTYRKITAAVKERARKKK